MSRLARYFVLATIAVVAPTPIQRSSAAETYPNPQRYGVAAPEAQT